MEDEDDFEGVVAVLRSDLPAPVLRLRDATIGKRITQEYADYTDETLLYAQIVGRMCTSRDIFRIDTAELANLVQSLRAVSNLGNLDCAWATYDRTLELRLAVQLEKLGPPVECDVWLRDADQEEHHCRFETNLTWVAAFWWQLNG